MALVNDRLARRRYARNFSHLFPTNGQCAPASQPADGLRQGRPPRARALQLPRAARFQ